MKKYVICDTATCDYGKTQTLLKVIEKLKVLASSSDERPLNDKDIFAIFDLNLFDLRHKRIIVDTMGDPGPTYEKELMAAVDTNADIIVCASRTAGNTIGFLDDLEKLGYEIIRFSNFYAKAINTCYESCLHDLSADAIVKLILTI